ncbi:hypothetical protein AAFN86_13110 [Roseomonas sp. CAU 1739]|uniref:hypothetical protein n=1 Tax=Roseomonas sp. CAU 1739 TaxID=3140364 RepID=UPI00325B6FB9
MDIPDTPFRADTAAFGPGRTAPAGRTHAQPRATDRCPIRAKAGRADAGAGV